MSSALLGLVAAFSWGVYDFLSRFPSRAVGPIPTVLAVTVVGLDRAQRVAAVGGGAITIVWPELWLVAVTGIFFALGTLALFAAFARGPMTDRRADRRLLSRRWPCSSPSTQGARPSAAQWLAVVA